MNMIKKCTSLLLCLLLLLSLLPQTFAAQTETVPEGYTAIATPEDLWLIRNDMAGNYMLTADIDLTEALAEGGSLYNADSAWIPLGYDSGSPTNFTGILDGNGHKISGLKCTGDYGGLVYQNNGTIQNLTLTSMYMCSIYSAGGVCVFNYGILQHIYVESSEVMSMFEYVAGICAWNYGILQHLSVENSEVVSGQGPVAGICAKNYETIYHCQNYATVTTESYIPCLMESMGGICAITDGGAIELCYNAGKVYGDYSEMGGIVGFSKNARIYRVCNAGIIDYPNNYNYVAGIVGSSSNTTITDSYNIADVNGTYAGGIVGICSGNGNTYGNCYNIGKVTGTNISGSLVGRVSDESTCEFENCYYLNTMSKAVGEGTYSGSDPIALSDAMMQRQAAFSGFDFDTVWTMGTCSYKYPVLQGFDVHTLEHVSAKAATCNEDGNIEHWYCSDCQGYFTDSEATQATTADAVKLSGTHQYSATITAPTCTEAGYTTYTCSICSDSYTADQVAALNHSYVNGVCSACGDNDESTTEPEYRLDENLSFSMSISAGAEMTVSYNFLASAVSSYADFYLEITKDVAGGDPITTIYGITEDREALTAKIDPSTGEALMYQVTYKGINAKEMGDNFSTTLYAVSENGTIYYGNTTVSSIKDYLVNKIDDTRSIAELKTMAVDMLKYGAAAQIRLGYNTENLVTADLTEEQLAYATQEIPEAVNYAAATGDGANVNTNITVTSRVQLNLSCIYTTATAPESIKCVITDSEGKVLSEIAATNKNNVMFTAIYENVGAKEMRDVINATFYEGETAISKTVSWSVESYVAQVRAKTNVAEDELNMVNAMLAYGDAVAAYMEVK